MYFVSPWLLGWILITVKALTYALKSTSPQNMDRPSRTDAKLELSVDEETHPFGVLVRPETAEMCSELQNKSSTGLRSTPDGEPAQPGSPRISLPVLSWLARLLGLLPGDTRSWRLHSAVLGLLPLAVYLCIALLLAPSQLREPRLVQVVLVVFAASQVSMLAGLGLGNTLRKPRLPGLLTALGRQHDARPLDSCVVVVELLVVAAGLPVYLCDIKERLLMPTLIYEYSLVLEVVESSLLCAVLRRFEAHFRALREELEQRVAAPTLARGRGGGSEDLSHRILDLRVRHAQAVRLLAEAARCFEIQSATMMLFDFVQIVSNLFALFVGLGSAQHLSGLAIVDCVLWSMFPALRLVSSVMYAHAATSELTHFSTFTSLHQPNVSVLAMFNLSPGILLSMAQCVVTYLVILLQFQTTSPVSVSSLT